MVNTTKLFTPQLSGWQNFAKHHYCFVVDQEHHHLGYHPSGSRLSEDEEDWSNGVPDQQGDYPA